MDFMMDKKLNGYLVLVLIILKKEKSLPSKKSKRFWVRKIFKKRAAYGLYNNLVHELRIRDRDFYFK